MWTRSCWCARRELRTRRDGTQYLKLSLGDRTGRLAAIVRDGVTEARDAVPGRPGHPRARPLRDPPALRSAARAAARSSEAAPGSFAFDDLVDGPPHSAETMELEVRELVATVQDPHLHALLDRVLGPHTRDVGALPRARRRPSSTTRPTCTACSSTASRSPRA